MAVKTDEEKLAEVETAISRCLSAQAYSISGRSKQNPTLDTLLKERERLEARIAAKGGTGGMAINIGIPRGDY